MKARQTIVDLLPEINPTLNNREIKQLALYMCASMEGLTIFAGHEKPWSSELDALKKISIGNFMSLAKNTRGSKRK